MEDKKVYRARYRWPALACGLLIVTACNQSGDEAPPIDYDPIETQALNDPIMADPELSFANEGNMALTATDDHSLPPPVATRDAIFAATEEAAAMVGGVTAMIALPTPEVETDAPLSDAQLELTVLARRISGTRPCERYVRYDPIWAARMPEAVPIYPLGAVREGAGTDRDGCALRMASYTTPVSADDVATFLNTMAVRANYRTRLERHGAGRLLRGDKPGAAFALHVRRDDADITRVDMVTQGGL